MVLQMLLFVGGLVVLIKGADWLVSGASALARKHRVSDLAIGLTIVAFGTSAPELVVNSYAAWQGHQDIVFGNVIGSNNFNLFIVLGITGLIAPIAVQKSTVWKEIPISLAAAVLLLFFCNEFFLNDQDILSRVDGFILLVCFVSFIWYVYRQMKKNPELVMEIPATDAKVVMHMSRLNIWVMIVGGLAGLVIGGRLVVTSAVSMAEMFGVSQKIIGLTIVAMGTSLPELATSLVAALKKNNDIAVGNIVGSNIFNILLILSISSLVRPIPYNAVFNTDLLIFTGGTVLLFLAMFTGKRKKLDRWEAGILLAGFLSYSVFLIGNEV
ncbi:MAG: calcium/sodium antiporter [Mangrovibacterium sp.]